MKKIHSLWKLIIVLILGIGVISVTAGSMKVEAGQDDPAEGETSWTDITSAQDFRDAFEGNKAGATDHLKLTEEGDLNLNGITGADWIKIRSDANITVDLNGHTLRLDKYFFCTSDDAASSSSSITIKGPGTIDATANTKGYAFEIHGKNSSLTLDGVTVNTNNKVIDGDGTGQIVITNSSLSRDSKTYTSSITGDGGAVKVTGKTVDITNTSISGYQVDGNGGAIYLNNSNLTINNDENHKIENNKANVGGAIYAAGKSSVKLKNGFISDNSVITKTVNKNPKYGGNGGAIFAEDNSRIDLEGGTVANNSAQCYGGGIFLQGAGLTLTKGSVTGNTASERGGGIYANGNAVVNINGGTISANKGGTEGKTAEDANDGGGGIYIDNDVKLNVTAGDITGNFSYEGGGGGIRAGFYNNDNMRITITGGNISDNYSKGEGGGVSIGQGAYATIAGTSVENPVKILNNKVDDDTTTWGGGGVFVADGGTLLIQKALVTDNTAEGFGGGIAGCSTGRIIIGEKLDDDNGNPGAAIFKNKAKGDLENGLSGAESAKHDDHVISRGNTVFLNSGYQDYFCALNSTVYEKMLGGGSENYSGSYDSVKIEKDDKIDHYDASSIMGLTSNASDEDMDAAEKARTVLISGNESGSHGGGILCNGIMVMGTVDQTTFNDRLIVAGLKGIEDGNGNKYNYSDAHDDFSFEVLDDSYKTVATKNTYQFPDDRNVIKDQENLNKGIMYITIPYVNVEKTDVDNDGNIKRRTFYIHELPNGKDYKIDDTVYKVDVDGKQTKENVGIGADWENDGDAQTNILKITQNQISNVTVTTGNFTYDNNGKVTGFNAKTQDKQIPYAKKLDCGAEYAKYLWIGVAGTSASNGKINEDSWSVNKGDSVNLQNRTTNKVDDNTTDFVGGKDDNWGLRDFDNVDPVKGQEEKESWTLKFLDAFTNEKVKSYSIEKRWTDADNADGLRPAKVKAQLYTVSQDGTLTPYGDVEELKEDADGKLSYTWENLPYGDNYIAKEADEKGNAVDENGAVSDGYTATYKDVNNIEVNAYNHPADGMKYRLLTSDNQPAKDVFGNAVPDLVLNEANNWTGTFCNLDRTANYKVDYAEPITGQTYLYDHSEFLYEGRVVTNMHPQKTTEVGVTKKWMTSDPSSETPVTLDLYADGKKLDDKSVVLDGTPDQTGEDSAWHAKWTDLPANRYDADQKKSVKIAYTVKEATEVNGYVTSYRDQNGKKVKDSTVDGGTIYNTHLIDFTVTKKWEDNNNSDGKRPDQIKVRLRKGTKHYVGETVTLNDENQWTYTWIDLPEYDDNEKKISYTAEEIDLDKNYVSSSVTEGNSTVITNTYNPEKPQKPEETPDTPTVTPQNPNEVKLTIHKTFKGDKISDKDQKNLKFRVTGTGKKTDENGNEVSVKVDETVTYASFINGSYTFYHLYPGEYTVTETNSGVKGYRAEVKYTVDGKTSQKVNAAEAGKEYRIDITDTYHKEKNGSPDTSDHNNVPWNAAVAGIALLIGMTAIIFRKRYN